MQKCLLQIEEQLGWGASQQWHNDVFIELSERVLHQTRVQLSPTTLKRVWGKIEYNSAPSISTLNALSRFAGYANWRDFKNKSNVKKPSWLERKITPNLGVIVTSAAILTVVFVSLYSMVGVQEAGIAKDYSSVTFSSRVLTDDLPNSVVFDFNLNGIQSDSLYIQQFWDKTKTIKLKKDQEQATGIYYFPGYFRSKLLVDGEIVKEHDLFISTKDWVGTVDYRPVPKYIQGEQLFSDGLSMPASVIKEISNSDTPLISTFHLVQDFGAVSDDNLQIRSVVRNTLSEKWAVCQNLRIVILGTEGALIIPFSTPGCVSNLGLMLNEVSFNGKEHDLSAFGVDLSENTHLDIEIKNKKVAVLINSEEIYAGQYQESIGNFVGIRYRFLGAGAVEEIKVTHSSEAKEIINESFNTR
ncbi:MAG: hypothetical protein AAF489_01925 [Bacteroidota bacterium]